MRNVDVSFLDQPAANRFSTYVLSRGSGLQKFANAGNLVIQFSSQLVYPVPSKSSRKLRETIKYVRTILKLETLVHEKTSLKNCKTRQRVEEDICDICMTIKIFM